MCYYNLGANEEAEMPQWAGQKAWHHEGVKNCYFLSLFKFLPVFFKNIKLSGCFFENVGYMFVEIYFKVTSDA